MRLHLLVATVVVLALAVSPALAAPGWLTVDGDLSDWGLDPGAASGTSDPLYDTEWIPTLSNAVWVLGDDITTRWDSGREWYDIEALYMHLSVDGDTGAQYLSWAMVTSYPGMEPSGSGAASYREGTNPKETVDYAYRRHPVLALRFNGEYGDPYDYGIIMAPSTGSEAHPLDDVNTAPYDSSWDTGDTGTGRDSVSDTPELWDVYTGSSIRGTWRNGSTRGFGDAKYDATTQMPVDFDPTQTSLNTLLDNSGSVWAGRIDGPPHGTAYTEPNLQDTGPQQHRQAEQTPGQGWNQVDNFVWEGWVEFPDADDDGVDFDDYVEINAFVAMWCTNNTTFGDGMEYGIRFDDSPELGTWALLLCTGALGGWIRRRRR